MARTTPVHSGYTILNGAGTGATGNRIDVWVEYMLGAQSVTGNYTPITAYFYAALNSNYASTTSYASGLNSKFTVNGTAGRGVSGGAYDFTDSSKVNLLGSFSGNIPHETDGTKSVAFSGSFTTVSSYITGGTLSKTVTLPAIARAADLSCTDVTLGENCQVQWTPASKDHTFALKFSLGDWEDTVTDIAPGSTAKYTYSKALELELARQFTTGSETMTVTLTTYQGTAKLGSHSKTVTVTVPDREETRPQVEATLTPAGTPFEGLYVRGITRVEASITAQDPYGAEITGYTLTVGGKHYDGPVALSGHLSTSGTVTVTVSATNSRGFTGSTDYNISVIAYTWPRITALTAYRCDSQGEKTEDGQSLYLAASADFSDVLGHNSCSFYWRIKRSNDSWSAYQELTQGVVMDGTLSKDTTYAVEVLVADTVGRTSVARAAIASEKVYMHCPAGGTGLGIGGYVEETDLLDIYFRVNARQGITAPSINYRGICESVITAILPGVYRITGDTFGAPCTEGILIVVSASETGQSTAAVVQLAVGSTGALYLSTFWNGVRYNWRTIVS